MLRASHLTAFAVEAELQSLVEELGILQTVALVVGSRLLGTGIVGFYCRHGAIDCADGALETLLKVELAFSLYLSFSHGSYLLFKIWFAV
jgi:hypothetical protein